MADRSSTSASSWSTTPGSAALVPGDDVDLGTELLRRLEEQETRHGEGEGGEQRPFQARYEPPDELLALSGQFIGAAIEVHRHLGPGFTEGIYARALQQELLERGIPFVSEVPLDVVFKDRVVGQFRVDLIIDRRLVIELKSIERITSIHVAQTISYLRATGIRVGLIVNFNVSLLQYGIRRVLWR